jgi:hypothetical protein
MVKKSDNTQVTDKPKRKAPRTAWKPGQSGNPKGAPKDSESQSGIISFLLNQTPEQLAEMVGGKSTDLGRAFLQMPKKVQIKYLLPLRAFSSFMFEPNNSLWTTILERTEGKVKEQIEHSGEITWAEFIAGKKPDADGS